MRRGVAGDERLGSFNAPRTACTALHELPFIYVRRMARPKDPAKEKALLDAALALVLKNGMSGVKMSDLAREAGVAIGTAYVYFDDKATLLNALYSHVRARSVQRYAHLHDPGKPFMDNFKTIWHAYLDQVLEHPQDLVFIEQYHRSPFMDRRVVGRNDELLKPIRELIDRGKQEKLVRQLETEVLIQQLAGALNALAVSHHAGRFRLKKSTIEAAYRMAWDSVRA